MKYGEFGARVRERGEYSDHAEAEQMIRLVLGVLSERLDPTEAEDLAAQLPLPVGAWLTEDRGPAVAFGVREFLDRVASRTGAAEQTAQRDASAVLCTVAEAATGGELNDVLTQLPSGYAALFGRASLSG